MKKTLLTLFVAGTLVLTGCSAAEDSPSTNGSASESGNANGGAAVDTQTATIETLFALTPAEVFELMPGEVDEAAQAELAAIVTASIAKSKEGLIESSYNNLGGESYSLFYSTPERSEIGIIAVIDENGNTIPGLTAFMDSEYNFSLYSLSVAFESESIVGIKKANDNAYYIKVLYEGDAELDLPEIIIGFYVSVDGGLVNGILYVDNSASEDPILFKTLVVYGTDAKFDALYDEAVPFGQLPEAGTVISEENDPDVSESFDDVVIEDGTANSDN